VAFTPYVLCHAAWLYVRVSFASWQRDHLLAFAAIKRLVNILGG